MQAAPKERPILFSGAMVRALLDGTKTQTRRVVKPVRGYEHNDVCRPDMAAESWDVWWHGTHETVGVMQTCPYGLPGERLWVREAVAEISCRLTYRADTDDGAHCVVKRWTPSNHMPRWASRILLEITSVRVERLQDIGTEEIQAEGVVTADADIMERGCRARVIDFTNLWESINGAGSWDANPWVWVVEFKRVQADLPARAA